MLLISSTPQWSYIELHHIVQWLQHYKTSFQDNHPRKEKWGPSFSPWKKRRWTDASSLPEDMTAVWGNKQGNPPEHRCPDNIFPSFDFYFHFFPPSFPDYFSLSKFLCWLPLDFSVTFPGFFSPSSLPVFFPQASSGYFSYFLCVLLHLFSYKGLPTGFFPCSSTPKVPTSHKYVGEYSCVTLFLSISLRRIFHSCFFFLLLSIFFCFLFCFPTLKSSAFGCAIYMHLSIFSFLFLPCSGIFLSPSPLLIF